MLNSPFDIHPTLHNAALMVGSIWLSIGFPRSLKALIMLAARDIGIALLMSRVKTISCNYPFPSLIVFVQFVSSGIWTDGMDDSLTKLNTVYGNISETYSSVMKDECRTEVHKTMFNYPQLCSDCTQSV